MENINNPKILIRNMSKVIMGYGGSIVDKKYNTSML